MTKMPTQFHSSELTVCAQRHGLPGSHTYLWYVLDAAHSWLAWGPPGTLEQHRQLVTYSFSPPEGVPEINVVVDLSVCVCVCVCVK